MAGFLPVVCTGLRAAICRCVASKDVWVVELAKLSCAVSSSLEIGLDHCKAAEKVGLNGDTRSNSIDSIDNVPGLCRSAMQLQILLAVFNLLVGSKDKDGMPNC